MKLPQDSIISEGKLRNYLLTPRTEDDKCAYLALAGYELSNWRRLEDDIRHLLAKYDADLSRQTSYGSLYTVRGSLAGPNGRTLNVVTIWITLDRDGLTRFVTLYPNKDLI